MHKQLILIIVFIHYFGVGISAQPKIDMIEKLGIQEDIISLEMEITKLIKKHPKLSKMQGLKQYHVFWLSIDSKNGKKSELCDNSFLDKLKPSYVELGCIFKEKFLNAKTFVVDSTGNLVGIGSVGAAYVGGKSPQSVVEFAQSDANTELEMLRLLINKEADFAFSMYYPFHSRNFFIKNDTVFLVDDRAKGIGVKVYSLAEFVECCIKELVAPSSPFLMNE